MKRIVHMFNLIMAIIFYYLIILALGKMNLNSPFSAMLLFPVYFLLYQILKKNKFSVKNTSIKWFILQCLSSIFMLIMVYQLEVDLSWDWGRLLESSYYFSLADELDYPEYFMRYPNNQFWLTCLIFLSKILLRCNPSLQFAEYKQITILISCLFVQAAIYFTYKSAKILWNEQKAFIVGIIALLYVPFYLYAQYFYTDTPGLLLATILVYYFLKIETNKRKFIYALILGATAAVAFHTKIIVFIICISIVFKSIIKPEYREKILISGMIVVAFVGCNVLIEGSVNQVLKFDKQQSVKYEFPPTHWIMMALNKTGGFNQDDVVYTYSFPTYEEKKDANIAEIKERISDMGLDGVLKHILYTKQIRTWTNSCIAGDDYVSRYPLRQNSFCEKLFSCKGEYHWICLLYTWIMHISILFGIFLSAILSINRDVGNQKMLIGRIAIFGLFIFLSIWECNSRYLFTFSSLMILVAVDGWNMAYEKLKRL